MNWGSWQHFQQGNMATDSTWKLGNKFGWRDAQYIKLNNMAIDQTRNIATCKTGKYSNILINVQMTTY